MASCQDPGAPGSSCTWPPAGLSFLLAEITLPRKHMLEEDTSASRSLVEHSRSHGARTRQEGGRALGPGAQPRPCPRAQPEGYPPPCSLMTEKARAICVGGLRLKSKPRDSSKPTMEKEQPVIKAEGGKKKKSKLPSPLAWGACSRVHITFLCG